MQDARDFLKRSTGSKRLYEIPEFIEININFVFLTE